MTPCSPCCSYTPPASWLGRLRDFFVDDAKERVEAAVNLSGRDKFVAVPMKASLEDVGAKGCLPKAITHASQSSKLRNVQAPAPTVHTRPNLFNSVHLLRARVGMGGIES